MKHFITLAIMGVLTTSAFGSGFKCQSEDGYAVKLFNHVQPEDGTRVPAVLIVSHEEEGTLLRANGEEIRKTAVGRNTIYSTDGNSAIGAENVALIVRHREGVDTLRAGQKVPGTLLLGSDDETLDEIPLVCTYYLKG